jgi:hypothetical protein
VTDTAMFQLRHRREYRPERARYLRLGGLNCSCQTLRVASFWLKVFRGRRE